MEDGRVQELDGVTTTLIWTLPFTNFEEITAENAEEVFIRIRMIELSRDPMLDVDGKPTYVSPGDIRRRIGLISVPDLTIGPHEEYILPALREKARRSWVADSGNRNDQGSTK